MRTSAAPIKSARAVRKGLSDFMMLWMLRESERTQRRSPFAASVNKRGKENKSEVKGVDESESGGCPGEA